MKELKKESEIAQDAVQETQAVVSIDKDYIIIDDIHKAPFFDEPTRLDIAVVAICLKGYATGSIDWKPYRYGVNDFVVILPGQILQYMYRSDDFSAYIFVMSRRFAESIEMNMKEIIPIFRYFRVKHALHLDDQEVRHLLDYYQVLKRTARQTSIQYRVEMVRLLSQTFFYYISSLNHMRQEFVIQKAKDNKLFDLFYHLIMEHYKESREVSFYATKLCLTPAYFSALIKGSTGKSALSWINDRVIMEAKSLLRNTNMNIRQISDELNFCNPSFFNTYFKRQTGILPRDYRK
ncbi:MAG: AraC family transcriptional regulator [Tannerellaceae bacterium]|nr:AraC family transcriptional regulator [Tannerellaceae bacterium]